MSSDSSDASMPSADSSPLQTSGNSDATLTSITQVISNIVFPRLQAKLPLTGLQQQAYGMSRDDEDVLTEACQLNSHGFISNAIVPWIMEEYRNNASVSYPVAVGVAKEVVEEVTNVIRSGKLTPAKETNPELDEQLEIAFTRLAYRGDTCVSFRAYVERCWGEYAPNPQLYMSPYVAIVQSSGFGKSRLLRELSLMTSAETQGTMRVLYTCTRLGPSTGYPKATECLQKWLFGSNQTEMGLTSCLEAISYYAQKKWENVGTEWKELFLNPNADLDVETALKGAQVEQECDNPMETAEGKGLVVLAIDEARTLLTETSGATNKFRMLRHALRKANARIAKRQRNAGVLAVLVDTHSTVSDFTPSLAAESSTRTEHHKPLTLFPPFVLGHTMDIHWKHALLTNEIDAYKLAVCTSNETDAWRKLLLMGRPLWKSTFEASMRKYNKVEPATTSVLKLASRKMLLGKNPRRPASYQEATMFGVSSMLCRLGLRPYASSTMASRVVSDFMAILAYVNYENDGRLLSYASDPVLALGATKVWYDNNAALADCILPQLKKVLLNETLDTGSIGEVIARIILLIAMDSCVVKKENKSLTHRSCQFMGQFVSVKLFMKALVGGDPNIKMLRQKKANKQTRAIYDSWQSKWDDWQVGFCHFVQLFSEPTEDMLWVLLGRRAAGILPRNQWGPDLLLPIFHREKREASLILVQVKNITHHDTGYPQSATVKMHPSFVFSEKNTLSKKLPGDVIRVYMSLREKEDRFIRWEQVEVEPAVKGEEQTPATAPNVLKSHGAEPTTQTRSSRQRKSQMSKQSVTDAGASQRVDAFTLCIRSLRPWVLSEKNTGGAAMLPVLPGVEVIVSKLAEMASSLWDPIALARADLDYRAKMEMSHRGAPRLLNVMPDKALLDVAQLALLHHTLGGSTKANETEVEEKTSPLC